MGEIAIGFIAGFASALVGVIVGMALVMTTRTNRQEDDE
jgi:uncharacterized membrane protein YfcA